MEGAVEGLVGVHGQVATVLNQYAIQREYKTVQKVLVKIVREEMKRRCLEEEEEDV